MEMALVGVTIAPHDCVWSLRIPLVSWRTPARDLPRSNQFKDPERVNFLADQRNQATDKAVREHPEATHILNIESYYLQQYQPLAQLIQDYEALNVPEAIMGASTWALIESQEGASIIFYDKWATPEWKTLPSHEKASGIRPISSVGSIFIFPVSVWKAGVRFENSGFPLRFYYTNFCYNAQRMILLDFDSKFYRTWQDADIPKPVTA